MSLSDLADLGITSQQASLLVAGGELRRALRGVYLPGELPLSVDNRAACLAKIVRPHDVVCDHTAAWLLGVDCQPPAALDAPLDLDVVTIGGHDRTTRAGVHGGKRHLQDDEIWQIGGIRVTSPVRTACDLACRRGRRQALAVLDAFLRQGHLTQEDYLATLPRFRGRRGCTQLRELIPYADARAESLRESWARMEIIDAGLPPPEPQVWVNVPGVGRRRIDLGYRGRRVGVEYDGEGHHTAEEDVLADGQRRLDLRDVGWHIISIGSHDFSGVRLDRWLRELRDVFEERSPGGPRRYARAPRNDRRPR